MLEKKKKQKIFKFMMKQVLGQKQWIVTSHPLTKLWQTNRPTGDDSTTNGPDIPGNREVTLPTINPCDVTELLRTQVDILLTFPYLRWIEVGVNCQAVQIGRDICTYTPADQSMCCSGGSSTGPLFRLVWVYLGFEVFFWCLLFKKKVCWTKLLERTNAWTDGQSLL